MSDLQELIKTVCAAGFESPKFSVAVLHKLGLLMPIRIIEDVELFQHEFFTEYYMPRTGLYPIDLLWQGYVAIKVLINPKKLVTELHDEHLTAIYDAAVMVNPGLAYGPELCNKIVEWELDLVGLPNDNAWAPFDRTNVIPVDFKTRRRKTEVDFSCFSRYSG
jgi:hypothetical protein